MAAALTMLHPLFRERAIAVRRSGRAWLAAISFVLLAAVWLAEGEFVGRRLVMHPVALVVAFAALAYGVGRGALHRYHAEVATGWWAAAPVPAATRRLGAALVVMAVGLALVVAFVLFALVARDEPGVEAVAFGVLAGIALALTVAAITTRHGGVATRRQQVAAPLTAARLTPRDRVLPTLPLWQRKKTAARWRSGNGALQVGVLALMVPMGTPISVGITLLVSAAALVWLVVMLGTSFGVARAARHTLAALPLRTRDFVRAAVAYPASGTVAAVAVVIVASYAGGAFR